MLALANSGRLNGGMKTPETSTGSPTDNRLHELEFPEDRYYSIDRAERDEILAKKLDLGGLKEMVEEFGRSGSPHRQRQSMIIIASVNELLDRNRALQDRLDILEVQGPGVSDGPGHESSS